MMAQTVWLKRRTAALVRLQTTFGTSGQYSFSSESVYSPRVQVYRQRVAGGVRIERVWCRPRRTRRDAGRASLTDDWEQHWDAEEKAYYFHNEVWERCLVVSVLWRCQLSSCQLSCTAMFTSISQSVIYSKLRRS